VREEGASSERNALFRDHLLIGAGHVSSCAGRQCHGISQTFDQFNCHHPAYHITSTPQKAIWRTLFIDSSAPHAQQPPQSARGSMIGSLRRLGHAAAPSYAGSKAIRSAAASCPYIRRASRASQCRVGACIESASPAAAPRLHRPWAVAAPPPAPLQEQHRLPQWRRRDVEARVATTWAVPGEPDEASQ
jgi:hypothetical protein